MRSPITQNGRSKPMTTSLVAELMTVSVMGSKSFSLADGGGARPGFQGCLFRGPGGAARLAVLHDAGGVDDLVHELLLAIGHDMDPGNTFDLADLLDQVDAELLALGLLVLGLLDPLQNGFRDVHAGHVVLHPAS